MNYQAYCTKLKTKLDTNCELDTVKVKKVDGNDSFVIIPVIYIVLINSTGL